MKRAELKKTLAVAMSILLVWSLFGYVFPAYADEIEDALTAVERADGEQLVSADNEDEEEVDENDLDNVDALSLVDEDDDATSSDRSGQDAQDGPARDGAVPSDEGESKRKARDDAEQHVYIDGAIHVATFAQLEAIGSGSAVMTGDLEEGAFGTGEVVTDEDGRPAAYTNDADYFLDGDIALPEGSAWTLPDDFAGSMAGPEDADETRLYDPETDTIYIQNIYQLAILSSKDRAEMPVMTGDVAADTFGSGQLVFAVGGVLGTARLRLRTRLRVSTMS